MKLKDITAKAGENLKKFFKSFSSGPALFSAALFVFSAVVIISDGNNDSLSDISSFEAGRVADRDVVAKSAVSFVDEEATLLQMEAAAKQVPAVFRVSSEVNRQVLDNWNAFCDFEDSVSAKDKAAAAASIEARFPGSFSNEILNSYLSSNDRAAFRNYGVEALSALLRQGVFLFHREDIRHFNQDIAEFQSAAAQELIAYNNITTMQNVRDTLGVIVSHQEAPDSFKEIAVDLLKPFVAENTFFSYGETQKRIEEAKKLASPVVRNIEKGDQVIRRGFIITEKEMEELKALQLYFPKKDPRHIIGVILLIFLVYVMFILLRGKIIIGRVLSKSELYLLASIVGSYIIGSVLINRFSPGNENFLPALLVPTALFIMILSVFMGTRPAMIMSLALPLGAYLAGGFDTYSYIFALFSGLIASTVLHNATNRMILIKAGLLIALTNSFSVIVILLYRQAGIYDYPTIVFWAVINGIVCGMLTLGFLPPLEQALNAVTPFRLMELSDLNTPILKKLFTTAPGTYSHSLMVANLAEQACQDIGANALLARVGAYYHDIGKIENPDYFVENQTIHNRHDEIAPRLSATIIRSHVKLGVEKAQSLGLPKDVINIISEHHGNSVISWFYNKATEQEDIVDTGDFSYTGNPPRSKESAVVMLADITEAAVRTLNKPTAGKIDKLIKQLFDAKIEHGQLSESDLSFRDVEIIKNAFVRVLVSYYHTRIEYPKQKEEQNEQSDS